MVIGKSGDTVQVKELDRASTNPSLLVGLDTMSRVKEGKLIYKKEGDKIIAVKVQNASGIIQTCKDSVDICLGLIGILALFMGFMTIAERAGGINVLSRIMGPFFSRLFPDIPKGHPAMGHMMMNFSANLLGLDNAATPFGIKSMESLQELNPNKEKASNAQIMFLSLHAAGLNLIPVSVIAIRASAGAKNATDIFLPCMIVTFAGTVAAMIFVSIRQRINLLQPVILAWLLSITAFMVAFVYFLSRMDKVTLENFSASFGNGLLLFILVAIVVGGLYKRINIFDAFIDGAKGGFEVAIRIIPYLVGMLVAISLLRTSGTFDYVIDLIKQFFVAIGADTRFVDGLPTALVRPFSGSGARGMMVDTMTTYGADSFAGRLSSILQGCADTTFYVVAVYFGAVGIKHTRYSIAVMLLADLVAIITAIAITYLFFG
jgi:spore maturation protein SpmA